ncbi:MAG: endonuclease III [Bacteroidaceae bacterium]
MLKKERYQQVVNWFLENRPVAETELNYRNPYELLVAVILSAQCTDKRVNLVTPSLFDRFPTAQALSEVEPDVVLDYVHSISYPNNKAKHLVGMANLLVHDFDGQVPSDMDELLRLPGVGRKTANVIQAVIFNKATMAVDTHVFRVAHRIGLVPMTATTPLAVEKGLVKNIPTELISIAHHWLILHGRYVCLARKPKCNDCGLSKWCKYYSKEYLPQTSKDCKQ